MIAWQALGWPPQILLVADKHPAFYAYLNITGDAAQFMMADFIKFVAGH